MRLWTLAQANAAIPHARGHLAEGRRMLAELREEEAHVEDLRIVWGGQLDRPECPAHAEYTQREGRRAAIREGMSQWLQRGLEQGLEVKDLDTGLVDFRGLLGTQQVYLCWRDGEDEIRHWHTLDGGYTGRKPIPGLPTRP